MSRIRCDYYESLCDFKYDGDGKIPSESCVVFCHIDNIAEFFRLAEVEDCNYIVVSGMSDYGVCSQSENPVNADMGKWLKMLTLPDDLGYCPLIIPPRCRSEYCKATDIYSIKMYSFTKDTLSEIPKNIVRWFCVNSDVRHEKLHQIPFGIPEWIDKLLEGAYISPHKKVEDSIYVNFQSNTVERSMLKRELSRVPPGFFTVLHDPVSTEEYVNHLQHHRFVLCPSGNGLDSYRVLEAIYAGAVPILLRRRWNDVYSSLPVIYIDNYN